MKQRTQFLAGLCAIFVLFALAGCGDGGTQQVTTGDSAGETTRQVDSQSGNDQLGANQAQSE
ncbi:MAG: hypothetical protein ACK4XJ_02545 [Fimbriimonadaceae bacterium]